MNIKTSSHSAPPRTSTPAGNPPSRVHESHQSPAATRQPDAAHQAKFGKSKFANKSAHKPANKAAGKSAKSSKLDPEDDADSRFFLPTPLSFADFSFQGDPPDSRDAGDGDFATRIDAQPLDLAMLHGDIQQPGDAQLDQLCQQLAGPWPASEQVRVEMPVPGMGMVDIALENQAARLHVSVDAGNDAARQWFEQQRRQIEARLGHYTGKTVSLDFDGTSPAFVP